MPKKKQNVDPYELVETGDVSSIATLLDSGFDVNTQGSKMLMRTLLAYAVEVGRVKTVEFLIAQGSDVNIGDLDDATPLHFASRAANVKLASLLLDAGADVHCQDVGGMNALHHLASGFDCHPSGCETAKILLLHGADVDAVENAGRSALYFAASLGNHRLASFLIKQGANVSLRAGGTQGTALEAAMRTNCKKTIGALKAGAS